MIHVFCVCKLFGRIVRHTAVNEISFMQKTIWTQCDVAMLNVTMNPYYRVFGPSSDHPQHTESLDPRSTSSSPTPPVWRRKAVDCWWCLKPKSVNQHNRCYIPIRAQNRIDGSFVTAQEAEDSLTEKHGFFHCWQCALAYCQVHFPNICYKVHDHAHRNGFVGMLAPSVDPRFVTTRFNPFVTKQQQVPASDIIPSPQTGIFMRRVPNHEQCTKKFKEANIVMEESRHDEKMANEFPQCVMDSEQLLKTLEKNDSQESTKRKLNHPFKQRKKVKQVPRVSGPQTKTKALEKTSAHQSGLSLGDFF